MFKLIKLEERIVLDASALLEAAEQFTDPLTDSLLDAVDALAPEANSGANSGANSALDALTSAVGSSNDVAAVVSELTAPVVDGVISAAPASNPNRVVAIASNIPGYAYVAALLVQSGVAQSGRVMVFDPQLESLAALLARVSSEAGANSETAIGQISVIADMSELLDHSRSTIDLAEPTVEVEGLQAGLDVQLIETSRQLNTGAGQALLSEFSPQFVTGVSTARLDQQVSIWQQQAAASVNDGATDRAQVQLNEQLDGDSDLSSLPVSPDLVPEGEVRGEGLKLVSRQVYLNHPNAPVFVDSYSATPLALHWATPPLDSGGLTLSLSVEHGRLEIAPLTTSLASSENRQLELSGTVAEVEQQLSQIRYTADKNFAGTDTLAYGFIDAEGELQAHPENIWLQVVPASASAPHPQGRSALLLSPETELSIAGDLLSYSSSVAVLDLYYQVRSVPEAGQLMRQSVVLKQGDLFSQSDIDDGLMSYRHIDSSRLIDGFQFAVTDGVHEAAVDTLEIRMVGNLELARNSGIGLNSGDQITLDSTMLKLAAMGIDADELLFEVLATPRNGVLLRDGEVLGSGDVFTQAHVDAGQLSLRSDFYGEPGLVVGDSFHFAAITTRSSGQAGSYLPDASFPLRLTASEMMPTANPAVLAVDSKVSSDMPTQAASELLDYVRLYGGSATEVANVQLGYVQQGSVQPGYAPSGDGVQAAVAALNGLSLGSANGLANGAASPETGWLEINDWDAQTGGEFAQLREAAPYADTLQLTEDDMLLYRLLPDIAKTGI